MYVVYNNLDIFQDPPCYVFIRYGRALHQTCKNSMWKQFSIHSNYTGNVVGIAKEVSYVYNIQQTRSVTCIISNIRDQLFVWYPTYEVSYVYNIQQKWSVMYTISNKRGRLYV